MLVLYGAQVIRVLLDLAELQAQSVDIVFTAKANDPALGSLLSVTAIRLAITLI